MTTSSIAECQRIARGRKEGSRRGNPALSVNSSSPDRIPCDAVQMASECLRGSSSIPCPQATFYHAVTRPRRWAGPWGQRAVRLRPPASRVRDRWGGASLRSARLVTQVSSPRRGPIGTLPATATLPRLPPVTLPSTAALRSSPSLPVGYPGLPPAVTLPSCGQVVTLPSSGYPASPRVVTRPHIRSARLSPGGGYPTVARVTLPPPAGYPTSLRRLPYLPTRVVPPKPRQAPPPRRLPSPPARGFLPAHRAHLGPRPSRVPGQARTPSPPWSGRPWDPGVRPGPTMHGSRATPSGSGSPGEDRGGGASSDPLGFLPGFTESPLSPAVGFAPGVRPGGSERWCPRHVDDPAACPAPGVVAPALALASAAQGRG